MATVSTKQRYLIWISGLILFTLLNNLVITNWVRQIWSLRQEMLNQLKYAILDPFPTVSETSQKAFLMDINNEITKTGKIRGNENATMLTTFIVSYFPKPRRNYTFLFPELSNLPSIWERNSTFKASMESLRTRLATVHPEECNKVAYVGGWSCEKRKDGVKPVCLDALQLERNESCLVYSFGSGNDFSFERQMADFGCQVFVFDDDQHHNYPTTLQERLLFFKVRLDHRILLTAVQYETGDEENYIFIYRPLDNIMYILDHEDEHLDVLKIDIEDMEWDVFTESLCKLDVLRKVGQLIIEFHLGALQDRNATAEVILASVDKYNKVLDCLVENGFRLVASLPNELRLTAAVINDFSFTLNYEQLWINTRFNPPGKFKRKMPSTKDVKRYVYLLEEQPLKG